MREYCYFVKYDVDKYVFQSDTYYDCVSILCNELNGFSPENTFSCVHNKHYSTFVNRFETYACFSQVKARTL